VLEMHNVSCTHMWYSAWNLEKLHLVTLKCSKKFQSMLSSSLCILISYIKHRWSKGEVFSINNLIFWCGFRDQHSQHWMQF
jgi:hypothetical protein